MDTVELGYVIDRMHDIMVAPQDQQELKIVTFLEELLHNQAINATRKMREENYE